MNINEIIEQARQLSAEERRQVAEAILDSLRTSDAEVDAAWIAEIDRRLEEMRNGTVEPIPGEEVFARIRERFQGE